MNIIYFQYNQHIAWLSHSLTDIGSLLHNKTMDGVMIDMLSSFNCKINYYRRYSMMELPIIFASNEQDVNSASERAYDVISSGWSSSRLGQKETRANLLMYSPHDYRLYKCGEKFEN